MYTIGRLSQTESLETFNIFLGIRFFFNQVRLRDISLLCCKVLGQRQKHRPGSQGMAVIRRFPRGQVEGSTLKMAGNGKSPGFQQGHTYSKWYPFPLPCKCLPEGIYLKVIPRMATFCWWVMFLDPICCLLQRGVGKNIEK